jgi:hypothetical protein
MRGEPSDRLSVVQEEMKRTNDDCERLMKLLGDQEFREAAGRMAETEARVTKGLTTA